MKKKVLALLMASAMALSIAACGGGNAGQGSAPSTAGNPGSASSRSEERRVGKECRL